MNFKSLENKFSKQFHDSLVLIDDNQLKMFEVLNETLAKHGLEKKNFYGRKPGSDFIEKIKLNSKKAFTFLYTLSTNKCLETNKIAVDGFNAFYELNHFFFLVLEEFFNNAPITYIKNISDSENWKILNFAVKTPQWTPEKETWWQTLLKIKDNRIHSACTYYAEDKENSISYGGENANWSHFLRKYEIGFEV